VGCERIKKGEVGRGCAREHQSFVWAKKGLTRSQTVLAAREKKKEDERGQGVGGEPAAVVKGGSPKGVRCRHARPRISSGKSGTSKEKVQKTLTERKKEREWALLISGRETGKASTRAHGLSTHAFRYVPRGGARNKVWGELDDGTKWTRKG